MLRYIEDVEDDEVHQGQVVHHEDHVVHEERQCQSPIVKGTTSVMRTVSMKMMPLL